MCHLLNEQQEYKEHTVPLEARLVLCMPRWKTPLTNLSTIGHCGLIYDINDNILFRILFEFAEMAELKAPISRLTDILGFTNT